MKYKIFLGLGANMGDMQKNLHTAIALLKEKITDVEVAPIYKTRPVGYADQPNFLNTVICGLTVLSPEELLVFVKGVEKKIGRIKRFKNGPREIDIDILFIDNFIYDSETLEIPHPGIAQRDFVLKPLIDLDPSFVHPLFQKPLTDLYAEIKKEDVAIIEQV